MTPVFSYYTILGTQTSVGAYSGLFGMLFYDDGPVVLKSMAVNPCCCRFKMVQACLDVNVSEEVQCVLMDQEQLLTVHRSGEVVDHCYVDEVTVRVMESTLGHLTSIGQCPEYGCTFTNHTYARQLQHVEAHQVMFICNCNYLSSHRDTPSSMPILFTRWIELPWCRLTEQTGHWPGALYRVYHLRCPSCM